MKLQFCKSALCLLTVVVVTTFATGAPAQQPADSPKPKLTAQERAVSDEKKSMVQYRSRETIEQLFGRLCPGRCELVDLGVEMNEPRPIGDVAPGFESVTGGAYEVEPKAINVTILLDSKLPRNFQSNIPRMIQYRLQSFAPVVNVRPEILDFPEPQLHPMPPPMPETPEQSAEPPPMPEEPVAEEPPPAEDAAPAEEAAEPTLWDRLAPLLEEFAPWIGPILMVMVLFALTLVLIRRLNEAQQSGGSGADASPAARRAKGEIDVDTLQTELESSRAVRNRVLRRWIEEDEEAVAQLVRLMGPSMLADLKNDASLKPRIETVSELVAREREPLDDEEINRLANEAQARLTSARIVHDEQGLATDWEFLEGLGVANLRRILHGCTTSERVYVVGQLPPSLRSAYLETLEGGERRELFLGTSSDTLSKQEAIGLAARLRRAADEVSHIGKEADGQAALVIDMLAALPLEDQEETLRDLKGNRPEVAQAVLARICLESTALQAPGEALADAIHRTPVETLVAFLRGTREDIREHLLGVAPGNKREAVMTELSLDVPVGKTEFLESRDTFTGILEDVLQRDGHDMARLNSRSIMSSTNINPVTNEASV